MKTRQYVTAETLTRRQMKARQYVTPDTLTLKERQSLLLALRPLVTAVDGGRVLQIAFVLMLASSRIETIFLGID